MYGIYSTRTRFGAEPELEEPVHAQRPSHSVHASTVIQTQSGFAS